MSSGDGLHYDNLLSYLRLSKLLYFGANDICCILGSEGSNFDAM